MKDQFIYSILKYVHSESSGESINIGVLLFWPLDGNFYFEYAHDLYRIKNIYDLKSESLLKESLTIIAAKCRKVSAAELFFEDDFKNIDAFINSHLYIHDASALQFSMASTCHNYFSNPKEAIDFLSQQYFINKQKKKTQTAFSKPKSVSIIKKFEEKLTQLGLFDLEGIASKVIKNYAIKNDTGNIIHFDMAWQNGYLNLVKPINLDLSSNKNIVEKVYLNFGQFSDLKEEAVENNLCFNLFIDKPSNADFMKEYEHAIKLLSKLDDVKIVTEENIENYTKSMYEQIKQDLNS